MWHNKIGYRKNIGRGSSPTLQYGHNWNSSWTYTVGIPTGVWVKMWNREHKTICNSRVPSNSQNFSWLGCAKFWSTVVSPFQPFACESLFSNFGLGIACPQNTVVKFR
jgi:hypothetical protein